DVDHIDQLEALASASWFKPGSIILITTRDEHVLTAHGVKLICDINLLSDKEAICLFRMCAFGSEIPSQGYEELSGEIVRYAAGLPLTVRVLGSSLCGTTKEDAIRILECCGCHARYGLKVLELRSLITVDENGYLGMHDHIEEMGKYIVRRKHPGEPNKHSHLWVDKEIEDILANDMGTEETSCLKLHTSRENSRILMKGVGKMKKLQYLEVDLPYYGFENDPECLDDTTQYFPNSLKYLKCQWYPFLYLPKTFQANNLLGLEMNYSRMVQLWEEGEKKVE
nr:Toll/interleukin-1 receptor (TIR) domain-containing protein [Tanacetum cinerariifolium]